MEETLQLPRYLLAHIQVGTRLRKITHVGQLPESLFLLVYIVSPLSFESGGAAGRVEIITQITSHTMLAHPPVVKGTWESITVQGRSEDVGRMGVGDEQPGSPKTGTLQPAACKSATERRSRSRRIIKN